MKQLTLILKEPIYSTMFSITYPKDTVLNVTLMNNRIYVHYPKNETCLIAVAKKNIKEANFKFKGRIEAEFSPLDVPMYFKDEGGFYIAKVTKDGKPIDPMQMYEYGTLKELPAYSKKEARTIAKQYGCIAKFD